jgi:hypothetical protein
VLASLRWSLALNESGTGLDRFFSSANLGNSASNSSHNDFKCGEILCSAIDTVFRKAVLKSSLLHRTSRTCDEPRFEADNVSRASRIHLFTSSSSISSRRLLLYV